MHGDALNAKLSSVFVDHLGVTRLAAMNTIYRSPMISNYMIPNSRGSSSHNPSNINSSWSDEVESKSSRLAISSAGSSSKGSPAQRSREDPRAKPPAESEPGIKQSQKNIQSRRR